MNESTKSPAARLGRRGLIKASVLGPVAISTAATGWFRPAQAHALFPVNDNTLLALAGKVLNALPADLVKLADRALSAQVAGLAGTAIDSVLQLLHRDDLVNGRVHDVHGIGFTHTQIGVLSTFMRKSYASTEAS